MQVKNEFFYFFLAFLSDPQVNLCYDIFWDYYYKSFQLFYMYSRNLFVLDFVRKTPRVHTYYIGGSCHDAVRTPEEDSGLLK